MIAMKMKGQSAMEYLMTYGWAIIIIVIVAAALYALGVFNPATYSAAKASGFPNMGIPKTGSWVLRSDGSFQLALSNNIPARINITAIDVDLTGIAGDQCSGESIVGGSFPYTVPIGGSFTLNASCSGVSAGSAYTASIEITYTNLDTGITGIKERGTVMGTVS